MDIRLGQKPPFRLWKHPRLLANLTRANDVPKRVGSPALLVARVEDLRPDAHRVHNHGARLQRTNQRVNRPIVLLAERLPRLGVDDVSAKRIEAVIHPNDHDVAVIRQQLSQLLRVPLEIGVTVAHQFPLPGGKTTRLFVGRRAVDPQRHLMFAACGGHFANHVATTVFPGRIANAELGRLRRPKAETVVVLAGKYEVLCTECLRRQDPLFGVQFRGVEPGRIRHPGHQWINRAIFRLVLGIRRQSQNDRTRPVDSLDTAIAAATARHIREYRPSTSNRPRREAVRKSNPTLQGPPRHALPCVRRTRAIPRPRNTTLRKTSTSA